MLQKIPGNFNSPGFSRLAKKLLPIVWFFIARLKTAIKKSAEIECSPGFFLYVRAFYIVDGHAKHSVLQAK